MAQTPVLLRDITTWITPLDEQLPTGEVDTLLRQHPGWRTVVVHRGSGAIATISRVDFYMHLAEQLGSGRAESGDRPIGEIVADADEIDAAMRADEFGLRLLESGRSEGSEDVIVVQGARVGLVDVSTILIATGHRLRAQSSELEAMVQTDSLTGIANRLGLRSELADRLDRSDDDHRATAVLFVDIDRFKLVNDAYGHATGDQILKAFADRIRSVVRDTDVVGRLAGDEFVVICPRAGAYENAIMIAQRVGMQCCGTYRVGQHTIDITASIGVAIASDDSDVDDLLRNADMAMYEAKRTGRGRVHLLQEAEQTTAIRSAWLEARLPGAIAEGSVTPHYQPIFGLGERDIIGFEALARWDLDGENVSPAEFIPIVERAELMPALTDLMVRRAGHDLAELRLAHGEHITVSVNASARHASTPMFVDQVRSTVEGFQIPDGALTIEITEAVAFDRVPDLVQRIAELRELGVSVVLDDFGSGYASLSELSDLPVSGIKIDKILVERAHDSDLLKTVLRSIFDYAREHDLKTVAEGLETDADIELVRALGCTNGQGFIVGRATPLDAAVGLGRVAV